MFTKGLYKVLEVFHDDHVHFEGFDMLANGGQKSV